MLLSKPLNANRGQANVTDIVVEEIEFTPDHKDFNLGYDMGVDALEQMHEKVKQQAADHEPLILMGMLTVLIEVAYRACVNDDAVDEMIEITKELAKEAMNVDETVH